MRNHYDDVIMTMLASQITSLPVVCSIVYSDVNQRKHQSSASLAFVREIHRGPVNFPHKWPVTRKMFPFDDVIMGCNWSYHTHGGYFFAKSLTQGQLLWFNGLSVIIVFTSSTKAIRVSHVELMMTVFRVPPPRTGGNTLTPWNIFLLKAKDH